MSDEQRKEDEIEVEGHRIRVGVDEEPAEEGEAEVEAHVHRVANVRMDSPSNT
jgi:hypothetical protein